MKTIAPCWVFLFAVVAEFVGMAPMVAMYDEGLILFGAERVFQGDVPYRDFWTMYGPGQFYLTSFLYSIFGVSDLVLRSGGIVIKGVITSLCYVIVARFTGKGVALIAAVVIHCFLIAVANPGFPVFPALALAIASMLFFELGLRRGARFLVLSGVCTGLMASFRHDLGAYAFIASVAVIFFLQFVRGDRQAAAAPLRTAGRQAGAYTAGVALVAAPVAALLLYAVPWADLHQNLIEIPTTVYPAFRALPFPGLRQLAAGLGSQRYLLADFSVYVPLIVAVWASVGEFLALQRRRSAGATTAAGLAGGWSLIPLLVVASLLFMLKGVVRVSAMHMVQALVLSIMLMAIVAARTDWRHWRERLLLAPGLALAALLLAYPVFLGVADVGNALRAMASRPDNLLQRCTAPVLPRLRCVTADEDHLMAARYVKAQSLENDLIYVGTERHDRIFVNAVALYFMAERRSITRWHELHPGIQTTADVQRAMIAEFQARPVRFLVLDSRWDHVQEPNGSRVSSGVTLLDDYIRAHFQEVQRFGAVRILASRS